MITDSTSDHRSGDSYSDTMFECLGDEPSNANPMGNHGPGLASWVQETRWPVFLTTKYNDSLLYTYNFAKAGAMVSRDIIRNTGNRGKAMTEQFEDLFKPAYVDYKEGTSSWTAESSLFIIFIGINDNLRLHDSDGHVDGETQREIMHAYQTFMNDVSFPLPRPMQASTAN